MTKKDYILFADVLKKELNKYPKPLSDDIFPHAVATNIERQAIMELTLSIAYALQKDNERFDKTKF